MTTRGSLLCALAFSLSASSAFAQPAIAKPRPQKKVLVELYTSQGCNSCPPANDLLGQLGKLGYGPDKIVPVAFHVDYFNQPWVDPFSRKEFSQREAAYNDVLKRNDLYFTPMMMVDGRTPMLGSNRDEALRAIKKALTEEPAASLKLTLGPDKTAERKLTTLVEPLSSEIHGRTLMIGVAVVEGPISTRVRSGENGGQTLVEPFVVRSFAYKKQKLEAGQSLKLDFPLKLAEGGIASRSSVSAFVQDWESGRVYQADSVGWVSEITHRK